ncbi:hypothetical protein BT96DRAFT_818870 [Gymnopus androsaceus JB14]|uniref:Uncharacterized protein n=1 Tax=Gymnopus androsaceus JB14 TaxID=1447944 RepID=A0A6A4HRE5_9AGAR|nr:hypothetical protein BT96DRAFT_818870 [Gymnopus androsaceus JB14]
MFAAEGSSSQPWNCTVDNHEIINFLVETGEITNIFACDSADILQGTTGEHTLNVQLIPNNSTTNATQSTVWLDSILYQPLPTDPLDSVMLRIHNSDPSVSYGNSSGAWTFQGYQSNATGTTATSMNFAFNGSSVTLYSVNFGNPIYNASTAFYTIDGTSSTDFVLPGSTNVSSTGNYTDIINYPLFTASDLSESHQHIEVATSYNALKIHNGSPSIISS